MYDELIKKLLESGAKKVTHFISKNEIIRAVRTSYNGKFLKGNLEITLTRGKPNYAERMDAKSNPEDLIGSYRYKYLPKKKVHLTRKRH